MSETYAEHLRLQLGRGHRPDRANSGLAGGDDCGNTIRFHVQVTGEHVTDAGFDADGCTALGVAASYAVQAICGERVLAAARLNAHTIIDDLELVAKAHVGHLVEDAVHVALGRACYEHACLPEHCQRTLVALSGGVDSSTVTQLSLDEGLDTVAVTLELWRDTGHNDAERSCCSASAVRAARAQAHRLGVPHFTLDLRDEFAAGVVKPYIDAHRDGLTPNPCVSCNGDVRLDAMLDLADRLGCRDLATGHYARIVDDGHGPLLAAAADASKDQTYMLARLPAARLARLRLPLGELTKPQVRELAGAAGLDAAGKPDSQDLCFLAGTDRRAFLARHGQLADRPGALVHVDGHVLGEHRGAHLYTLGQRKGLGVSDPSGPLYVVAVNARANRVTLGPRSALAARTVALVGARLHRTSARVTHIRLRYHSQAIACRPEETLPAGRHRRMAVTLGDLSDSVVPGQSAQLLDGDLVVGQAFIAAI